MRCEQAEIFMAELLAGEVKPPDREALEKHLLDCASCRADFELARAGAQVEWPQERAPEPLAARTLAAIRRAPASVRFLRAWTAVAAAACVAIVVLSSARSAPSPSPAPPAPRPPVLAMMQEAVIGSMAARDEEGRPVGELGLKSHHVTVEILDGIAKTTVEENFENHTDRRLEGTFHFPLPPDASISRLALEVNGKMEEGTCLERERARQVFESIVRKMQDPALLEWMPGGIFKCRVFPIEPRSTKRVLVAYTQALPFFRGKMSYVYPLASEKTRAHPPGEVRIDVAAKFSGRLEKIESPSHRLDVQRRSAGEAAMSFRALNYRGEKDFVLTMETADEELRVVPHKGDGDDGYFALFLTPRGAPERKPDRYAFVLDVSASVSAPELEVSKKLVRAMIERGIPGDRFEILAHNVEVESSGPVDLREANDFMDRLRPVGACDVLKALRAAPEGAEVVYIGEGTPTLGEADHARILEAVKGRRIRTVAVGSDANLGLLEKLGGHFRVSANDDVNKRVSEIAATLGSPVLSGIGVEGGGAVYDVVGVRDIFYGERLVVTGRYRGPAAKLVVTGKDYRREVEVSLPHKEEGNNYVRRLWAQRKVADLLAQGGKKEEVTALGIKHQIMTPYTSFLVLESEQMWKDHQLKREVQKQDEVLSRSGAALNEALELCRQGKKDEAFAKIKQVPAATTDAGAVKAFLDRGGKSLLRAMYNSPESSLQAAATQLWARGDPKRVWFGEQAAEILLRSRLKKAASLSPSEKEVEAEALKEILEESFGPGAPDSYDKLVKQAEALKSAPAPTGGKPDSGKIAARKREILETFDDVGVDIINRASIDLPNVTDSLVVRPPKREEEARARAIREQYEEQLRRETQLRGIGAERRAAAEPPREPPPIFEAVTNVTAPGAPVTDPAPVARVRFQGNLKTREELAVREAIVDPGLMLDAQYNDLLRSYYARLSEGPQTNFGLSTITPDPDLRVHHQDAKSFRRTGGNNTADSLWVWPHGGQLEFTLGEAARLESYDLRAQTFNTLLRSDPLTNQAIDPMRAHFNYTWGDEHAGYFALPTVGGLAQDVTSTVTFDIGGLYPIDEKTPQNAPGLDFFVPTLRSSQVVLPDARIERVQADQDVLVRQLEVQQAQIQELSLQLDQARGKLARSLGEKSNAASQLQYERQAVERLQQNLAELEAKHVEVSREKKTLEEKINHLNQMGIKMDIAPARPIEGKATAVANEIGLTVLSVGKDDGVLEGDQFTVYRGGEFVAKVVVDRADRKWSAGKVVLKKSDPRPGDDISNHIFVSGQRMISGQPGGPPVPVGRFALRELLEGQLSRNARGVSLGKLDYDPQTRAFIVRDTSAVLDRMGGILKAVDVEAGKETAGGIVLFRQLFHLRVGVSMSFRNAAIEDVVEEFRRQTGWKLSLDRRGIPAESRVAEFAVQGENPRKALDLFAAKAELWVEEVETGSFTLSRPARMTVDLRDADIADVLRRIAEASGREIAADPDVQGKLTLFVKDVPWPDVLASAASTLGVVTAQEGPRIRLLLPDAALRQMETRVFKLSWLSPERELQETYSRLAAASSPEVLAASESPDVVVLSADVFVRRGFYAISRDSKFVAIVLVTEVSERRARGGVWQGLAAGRVLPGDRARPVADLRAYLAALPEEVKLELSSKRNLLSIRAKMGLR